MKKRVTIYEIAERLHISTATVYRALNDKPKVSASTREAVLKTAREMGFKANTLARSLARKQIRLAVVAFTSFPEFHNYFIAGAKEASEELMDYNIRVDYFNYEGGDSYSESGNAYLEDRLKEIAESGYDGMLIAAKEANNFSLLKERKVVVATAINDIRPEMRRFCIQYNGRIAGRMAAELLWRQIDHNKKIVISSGLKGKGIHNEIVTGFYQQLRYMPLSVACVYYCYDNEQIAYEETNRVLEQYPDIGGIYVNSFNSVGVIRSIKEHGLAGKICVITSDIYDELRKNINDGIVTASIFQDQYTQGRRGLRLLYQTIAENIEVTDRILINPQVIMHSNMELFE
jgi:LacI family transcriptional regulator